MSAATKIMRKIADRAIQPPQGNFTVTNTDATTQAIIRNVLDGYRASKDQLRRFAKELADQPGLATLYNIWDFTRHEIEYRLDPADWQWIKTPQATWESGFADCKSKSIFVAALLNSFGIPFDFRFTSYSDTPTYTHVYIIAHLGNDITIPIDPVFPEFATQKEFTFKKDFAMKIAQIGKLTEDAAPRKATHGGKLSKPQGKSFSKAVPASVDIFKLNDNELHLYLHLQKLKLKQAHAKAVKGVGSMNVENLQDQIEATEDLIRNARDPQALDVIAEQIQEGAYNTARSIQGIGATQRQAARQQKKAKRNDDREKRKAEKKAKPAAKPAGKPKGIKKVVEVIKKGAALAIKAATVVPRTIIKGVIELELPKAAPNFKYLFVNKPELIAKLPEAARKKRKKQEEIFLFITKAIGMKSDHVMAILRNGIIERTGKEPEQLLAAELGGSIAGIGIIDDAFEILVKIIEKIAKAIGKKGPSVSKNDVADVAADFPAAGGSQAKQIAREIEAQQPDTITNEGSTVDGSPTDGGGGAAPRKGFC